MNVRFKQGWADTLAYGGPGGVVLPGMIGEVDSVQLERHDQSADVKITVKAIRVRVNAISLQGQKATTEEIVVLVPVEEFTRPNPGIEYTTVSRTV